MKKKGFTLVELLAVIVILAVIALITTPTILGVIETARKGSAESSALGYIDAVEKQIAINTLDSSKTQLVDGTYTVKELTNVGVTVKGESPEYTEENKSWVKIKNNQVVDYSLKFDKYIVNYDEKTNTPVATKNGTLKDMESTSTISSGPTKVNAQEGETHKGIVYLDPTDLTKTCDSTNSISTTETKTGCMKWYIYSEDNSTYTMILDHNTTALVAWNSSGSNASMKEISTSLTSLTSTSGWKVTPRLITTDEIATITGNTTFNSETSTWDEWFWFETNGQTDNVPLSSYTKAYAWLTDYTYDCSAYECNIEDNNSYIYDGTNSNNIWGYWTSTPVAGLDDRAWYVFSYGDLYSNYVNVASYCGLRPVITVSKNVF